LQIYADFALFAPVESIEGYDLQSGKNEEGLEIGGGFVLPERMCRMRKAFAFGRAPSVHLV
jgi:hypothetical protein